MSARADLHIYSKYSDRAEDWVLRRLDFPASFSDPRAVYDQLRAKGMTFVTLTDQNTIAGCQEIMGLPGTFLSEEVTATFPEDGCRVNVLAYGITEPQHEALQAARENVYDLQRYLAEAGIAHAVAHPLHAPREDLTPLHFRKLALLFRHFEGVNGRYSALLSDTARFALGSLTEEAIERFAAETGIQPTHQEAWKKVFVGGSDDHGGVFPARGYTETADCGSVEEFLNHVRLGDCRATGRAGSPLAMAHGTYNVAFQFAKARLEVKAHEPGVGLVEKMFSRFMEGRDPTEFTFGEKLNFLAQGVLSGKIFEMAKPGNSSIWKELATYFSEPKVKAALAEATAGVEESERRAFLMANLIANQLGFRFFNQFIGQITSGKIIESIQTISPLVPIVALLSPYIHALRMPKRTWLAEMSEGLCGRVPESLHNTRRVWFTDTLEDVNGVATTIKRMTSAGVAAGYDLQVVVSSPEIGDMGIPLKNFPPVGEFELPEYELQRLSFPPVLEMAEWMARENVSEVIISTPGPVGLAALAAAKALGLRTAGIYHTAFPQYVKILTDDAFMETLTWNFMHWFYTQMDLVWVNSEDYRKEWVDRGIPPERIKILPRGLDIELFHPTRRARRLLEAPGIARRGAGDALRRSDFEGEKPRPHGGGRATRGRGRGAPGVRWRRTVSCRDGAAAAGRNLHGRPFRSGPGDGLLVGGFLRLSEHDGHVWQCHPRSAGQRIADGRQQRRRTPGPGARRRGWVCHPGSERRPDRRPRAGIVGKSGTPRPHGHRRPQCGGVPRLVRRLRALLERFAGVTGTGSLEEIR